MSKLSLLVDSWGVDQAMAMLEHLEQRMRTKQGAMKNGPGYLDVAVCSHLDMLKVRVVVTHTHTHYHTHTRTHSLPSLTLPAPI